MEGLKEKTNPLAPGVGSLGGGVPITDAEVRLQLEFVLQNSLFNKSKRLSRFLRFVVEQTIAGHAEDLKERTLAVQVFDRALTCDMASDPIVRVAAGDVRKRLAQYYVQQAHKAELRIALPPGRYRPLFQRPDLSLEGHSASAEGAAAMQSAPQISAHNLPMPLVPAIALASHRRPLLYRALAGLIAASVIASSAAAVYLKSHRAERGLHVFWSPLPDDDAAIMCVGDFDHSFLTGLQPKQYEAITSILAAHSLVGPANLTALTLISGLWGKLGKAAIVSPADAVSLTELRRVPAVMIGALDNQWTAHILNGKRFQFIAEQDTRGFNWLTDAGQPKKIGWGLNRATPLIALQRDYGLIARVHSQLTGQVDFVIAGIGPCGTIAASEFVTRPEYFEQFLSAVPHDWDKRDIEIVVSTDLVNGRSGPPRMIALDLR